MIEQKLTTDQISQNWGHLRELIHQKLGEYSPYLNLLETMKTDQTGSNGIRYFGMRTAPAARKYHHNYEGGLVAHYLEMWDLHLTWRARPSLLGENNHLITDERVLSAILNHDLHKGYLTYPLPLPLQTDEVRASYNGDIKKFDDDREGTKEETDLLMTHDVKTLWLLSAHHVPLDPIQMNALCLAEGGYAKIVPERTTTLAKYCYFLDDMSGNVLARVDKGEEMFR